jgi:hypothetical protein
MDTERAEQIVAAIRLAMDCILDAARAAGSLGAPSGIVYAGLSAHGMRLATYQSIISSMVNAGQITIGEDYCIHIATPAA